MRQRGRKSTARLSVLPISIDHQRPEPPSVLSPCQADLWRRIVADAPAGWFRTGDLLLELFCRHVDSAAFVESLIQAEHRKEVDLKRLNRLLAMRARETQMITHLATKMRLTQQARIAPRSAGRSMEGAPNSTTWKRPWDQ